jgi:hypothetical protein
MAGDNLDVSLVDDELLAEVELTANLIVAAADSEGPLAADVVDRLLFAGTAEDLLPRQHHGRSGRPRHGHRRSDTGVPPGH